MLNEVLKTQKTVRKGNSDLEEIKRLIKCTQQNVNTHIQSVNHMRNSLEVLSQRQYQTLDGTLKQMKQSKSVTRLP